MIKIIIKINGKKIEFKDHKTNIKKIIEYVNSKTKENEIIKDNVLLNGTKTNIKYLLDSDLSINDIDLIEFYTQKVDKLIDETINQASKYLPKLNSGIKDVVSLFRNGQEKETHNKIRLIIDGLEWYTTVIIKITSLLDQKDLSKEIKQLINNMNKPLSDLMVAYNKDDYVLVADILEYEIFEYVETMIEFNERIKDRF
ncbi:MAG: hypothetical protein ACOCV1_08205 [Bacillota bacterium]